MQEATIGEIINYLRVEKEISKSALCYGLCSVTALTRYEEGIRIPDIFLLECILQRLGTNIHQYDILLNHEEYLLVHQRKKIWDKWNQALFLEMKEELEKYRKMAKHSQNIQEQFFLFMSGKAAYKTKNYEEAYTLFLRALSCTESNKNSHQLFSLQELQLFYCLAEIYEVKQENEKAVEIYQKIADDLKDKKDMERKARELYLKCRYALVRDNYKKQNLGLAYKDLQELVQEYQEYFFFHQFKECLELKRKIEKITGRLSEDRERDYEKKILALSLLETNISESVYFLPEDIKCQNTVNHL